MTNHSLSNQSNTMMQHFTIQTACWISLLSSLSFGLFPSEAIFAQEESSTPVRGSLVEDRAARKLLEAGDARYEAEEIKKALEVWQSVIERYPRSRFRFQAHMRLGNHFLNRDRSYDHARTHFQSILTEENRDEEMQAEATLNIGVCFYESRNYGKSFQIMRDIIENYPVSPQVNQAYYYIGLGHFQLGHYSRAIDALEKVGTSLSSQDQQQEKLEAGKRLFIKIEDADLAVLEPGETVKVVCEAASGDKETLDCYPVGRNVRIVLGNLPSRLGRPVVGNGILEVKGDDKVIVTYIDAHTADRSFDRPTLKNITVVGNAQVSIMDGAYSETLKGVVLGKTVNIQIADADRDLSDNADVIEAVAEVYRLKTDEELEAERIAKVNEGGTTTSKDETAVPPEEERYVKVDSVPLSLTEVRAKTSLRSLSDQPPVVVPKTVPEEKKKADQPGEKKKEGEPASPSREELEKKEEAQPEPETNVVQEDNSIHSGLFQTKVSLVKSEEINPNDDTLQALPGYIVRVVYVDKKNTGEGIIQAQSDARCVEGNLGGVRVTRAVINDRELRIKTKLKTASALTNIGNRYKDFGLKTSANSKYEQALNVCDDIMQDARKLGGHLLEETYVQLWNIYFEMDKLELAAAMCQRLQREFPNSGFVDDALLQLADVARKQGNMNRAIGIYNRLVSMQTSQLRGEAQFGIAQCYEQMAEATQEAAATQLFDRAFQEYKKVFDNFPESGRVGEAVAKMADHYYRQKDYSRAVDTFETVLSSYPDARFLDVILFNYGRCLYRMNRKGEARQKFDQLISEFPESTLAADAKKISDALRKAGI